MAECIRDLIIHYRLLPMQHGALSDDGRLLLCMCACVNVGERRRDGKTQGQVHCIIVEMIAVHF